MRACGCGARLNSFSGSRKFPPINPNSPASVTRAPRNRCPGKKLQIVQSQLNLRDLLPGFLLQVLCRDFRRADHRTADEEYCPASSG